MQPNYNLEEASAMLAMSYAADLLGPGKLVLNEKNKLAGFELMTPIADNPNNPITDDDGSHFPYPICPIWPSGWTPAIPVPEPHKGSKANAWALSIWRSSPLDTPLLERFAKLAVHGTNTKYGMNNVIFAYNKKSDTYAIAFAGTENALGGLEDVTCYLTTARGDLDIPLVNLPGIPFHLGEISIKSNANYVTDPNYYSAPVLDGQPPVVKPLMHFGIRLATEAFTVHATREHSLIEKLKLVAKGKKEINVIVTGHSLGGGIAQAFAAWLHADGIPGVNINVKLYSFAAPKIFNDVAADNFNSGLSRKGYAYRIANNLDTVPQLGFTLESVATLQNPAMVTAVVALLGNFAENKTLHIAENMAKRLKIKLPEVIEKAAVTADKDAIKLIQTLEGLPGMNYAHIGNPVPVKGAYPVKYNGPTDQYPAYLFPNQISPSKIEPLSETTCQWWQHWPWVYYQAMHPGLQ